MKYILVSGGVISGVGKGVISSSLGSLLKTQGLRVTSIKIDPYLNIDAGTFSPYEHGETYVLDDGGEVDLDLGNYERFLDITLHRDNNITTGKIYQHVIEKERRGDYLGKTVQVVPHVSDAIQDWIERVAKIPTDGSDHEPDVCIIELGGTVGDIESMPFVEAFRQFQFRVGKENFLLMHVCLVPVTSSDKEQKTKPTQHSIRELRGLGLSPDVIICRSADPLGEKVRSKIAMFCHVEPKHVLSVHDCSSIYRVPLLLETQGVFQICKDVIGMTSIDTTPFDHESDTPTELGKWRDLADRYENLNRSVKIVLVGKYTALSDAYASVIKALRHSCLKANHKLDLLYVEAQDLEEECKRQNPTKYHEAWGRLCTGQGILVPGGFGTRGIEGKIAAINWARTEKIPFFGICLGFQLAVVEFSRNILGWTDANSTEVNPDTAHPVIIDMPEVSTTELGGTMRLGKRRTKFVKPDCLAKKLYHDQPSVEERHRHRYEVNPAKVEHFARKGLHFTGHDTEGERMEILELDDHPFFLGVQYHPEFMSRPMRSSPPFFGFILASCGKLDSWLKNTSPVVSPAPSPAPSPVKPSPVKPSPVKTGTVKTGTV